MIALKSIVDAVSARDSVASAERLDVPKLKRSLLDQIGRAYLRVTGKDKGLSPLEIQLAVRAASISAGERVDVMLTPEALIELLGSAGAAEYSNLQIGVPRLETPNLRHFYRFIVNTEYSGRDFSIVMPFAADEESGYRIRLRLENWEWKLVGIWLPVVVQTKIASQISGEENKS